jgi:hypothetical protein
MWLESTGNFGVKGRRGEGYISRISLSAPLPVVPGSKPSDSPCTDGQRAWHKQILGRAQGRSSGTKLTLVNLGRFVVFSETFIIRG